MHALSQPSSQRHLAALVACLCCILHPQGALLGALAKGAAASAATLAADADAHAAHAHMQQAHVQRGDAQPTAPELDAMQQCGMAAGRLSASMTLHEKAEQLFWNSTGIARLGIPPFDWWTECLHGWFMPEESPPSTVFPTPLGLAASFDPDLVYRIATAVSDETRAYNADAVRRGGRPRGLNCFTPNINLLRDPRWGRATEVYGEDPELMARMAVAFVTGLQGEDPFFVKVGATCKHFAAHSLEALEGVTRHNWDALVDSRDLDESYLPAFKACVVEADVQSIMCAYNRVNGAPACANHELLQGQLGSEWGFYKHANSFVVSDCGAVSDIFRSHHHNASLPEAVAEALLQGMQLNCDDAAFSIPEAVQRGLVPELLVDKAVRRMLMARCRLGILGKHQPTLQASTSTSTAASSAGSETATAAAAAAAAAGMRTGARDAELATTWRALHGYGSWLRQQSTSGLKRTQSMHDRPEDTAATAAAAHAAAADEASSSDPWVTGDPWAHLDPDLVVGSPYHLGLALEAATKSITLLLNRPVAAGGPPVLPLSDAAPANGGAVRVAVLGPHADNEVVQLGTYYGMPSQPVITPLRALVARLGESAVAYSPGLLTIGPSPADWLWQCTEVARQAEVAIVFVGSSSRNWECNNATCSLASPVSESEGIDRPSLRLPGFQESLVQAVALSGTPVVVVLVHGGPLDVAPLLRIEGVKALLSAPYLGQMAGQAIVRVLYGDESPSGVLPVTWHYDNYTDLVRMTDMALRPWPGRTHRYLQVPVLFPFGYGLSYTSFMYQGLALGECGEAGQEQQGSQSSATGSSGAAGLLDWRDALLPSSSPAAQRAAARRQAAAAHGRAGGRCLRLRVQVTNTGQRAADMPLLVMLKWRPQRQLAAPQDADSTASDARHDATEGPLGPCAFECSPMLAAGSMSERPHEDGPPLQSLVAFHRMGVMQPGASAWYEATLTLRHWAADELWRLQQSQAAAQAGMRNGDQEVARLRQVQARLQWLGAAVQEYGAVLQVGTLCHRVELWAPKEGQELL